MDETTAGNRYAPPVAQVDDLVAAGPVLAGRGIRLIAALLDGGIAFALFFASSWLVSWNLFDRSAEDEANLKMAAIDGLLVFGVYLLVNGYLLVKRGQTVGKMLFGIRIRRTNGEPVGAARLLGLRYGVGLMIGLLPFIGSLYGLIDCLLIFRASRQCLHDTIADTMVVEER